MQLIFLIFTWLPDGQSWTTVENSTLTTISILFLTWRLMAALKQPWAPKPDQVPNGISSWNLLILQRWAKKKKDPFTEIVMTFFNQSKSYQILQIYIKIYLCGLLIIKSLDMPTFKCVNIFINISCRILFHSWTMASIKESISVICWPRYTFCFRIPQIPKSTEFRSGLFVSQWWGSSNWSCLLSFNNLRVSLAVWALALSCMNTHYVLSPCSFQESFSSVLHYIILCIYLRIEFNLKNQSFTSFWYLPETIICFGKVSVS